MKTDGWKGEGIKIQSMSHRVKRVLFPTQRKVYRGHIKNIYILVRNKMCYLWASNKTQKIVKHRNDIHDTGF